MLSSFVAPPCRDLENLGNTNNMTQYLERRGTCPYAYMAFMWVT